MPSMARPSKGNFYDALNVLVEAHETEIAYLQFEDRKPRTQSHFSCPEDVVLEERRSDHDAMIVEQPFISKTTPHSIQLSIPDPPEPAWCCSLSASGESDKAFLHNRSSISVEIPTARPSMATRPSMDTRSGEQLGSPLRQRRSTSPTRSSRPKASYHSWPPSEGVGAAEWGEFALRDQWLNLPESAALAWDNDLDQKTLEENTKKLIDLANDPTDQVFQKDFGKRGSIGYLARFLSQRGCPLVDPGSPKRMAWDVVGTFMIGYDLITIPLMVFDPEDTWITELMSWVCLCFWTLDMVATNCTGIYKDGDLIMDRQIIFKEYMRYWFALDCIVVIPDWILTIWGSSQRYGKLGRILRAARVVRILRLFRILKLRKLLNAIYDRIASEYMFLVMELVKLLLLILLLNHFVACTWYGVGLIAKESGTAKNWLEDVGTSPVWYGDTGWKYSTSLHWSITQFTPASMDIFATNTGERIFSVFILFWGLVALSSVVGSVTASITAIRNLSGDQQKHFWMLRQYMKQRGVSRDLSSRITRYLEFKLAAKKNMLAPGKVLLLNQVSEQLSFHLQREIKGPTLEVHPFFYVLSAHMAGFMDRICNQALKTVECAVSDPVFDEGCESIGMYFVSAGFFRYRDTEKTLRRNTFLSEAALWTHWRHRGCLTGVGEVNEIISILHGPFADVMGTHPKPWLYCKRYAEGFVKFIAECDSTQLSDIFAERIVNEIGSHVSGSKVWY